MSFPFLIWTMQRTGGTSLTELLMTMSEHRSAEHEPFNWAKKTPRQFWPITDAWNNTKDVETLRASLQGLFEQRFLIKHCYELLNMSFNMHLMQASAETPYRHILLLRRDEPSRLVSKFIAEAQGTWFRDYSRKVFTEVAEGERRLDPLPIDRLVGHYRHCHHATKFIAETLRGLGVNLLPIFFEDLYTGTRDKRLGHLHVLFDFLGFTSDELDRHRGLIESKIFQGGQNTPSVAPHVPNLADVLDALKAAGCDIEESLLNSDLALPAASDTPTGPKERISRECAIFARTYDAQGPFLEISNDLPAGAVLMQPQFASAERHFLSPKDGPSTEGIMAHPGDPNDMRDLFEDGCFGTVIWSGGLAHDARFWRTLDEIKRVLVPGGTLIVVADGFCKAASQGSVNITGQKGNAIANATITHRVHAAPDFWRISPQALREVILDGFDVREARVMMVPPRVFGVATKPK